MRPQDYIILALLVAGYWFYVKNRRKVHRKSASRRGDGLNRKEETALKLLKAKGYRLQEVHPSVEVSLTVDGGKGKDLEHRGAFTVEKGGRTFLVVMKRGDGTPLSSAALRKELLLDYLFFQPAGILLYDGEKKSFQEVDISFEAGTGERKSVYIRTALILLIIAGVIFWGSLFFEGVF